MDEQRIFPAFARYHFEGADKIYRELDEFTQRLGDLAPQMAALLGRDPKLLRRQVSRDEFRAALREPCLTVPASSEDAARWNPNPRNWLQGAMHGLAMERLANDRAEAEIPNLAAKFAFQPHYADLYEAARRNPDVPDLSHLHLTRERADWAHRDFPRAGIDLTTPGQVEAHRKRLATGHDTHIVTYPSVSAEELACRFDQAATSADHRAVAARRLENDEVRREAIRRFPEIRERIDPGLLDRLGMAKAASRDQPAAAKAATRDQAASRDQPATRDQAASRDQPSSQQASRPHGSSQRAEGSERGATTTDYAFVPPHLRTKGSRAADAQNGADHAARRQRAGTTNEQSSRQARGASGAGSTDYAFIPPHLRDRSGSKPGRTRGAERTPPKVEQQRDRPATDKAAKPSQAPKAATPPKTSTPPTQQPQQPKAQSVPKQQPQQQTKGRSR